MSGPGFLHRYFLNNAHKRLHKWLHYFDIYEHHLDRFRGRAPVVLEIGVAGGGSLAMWRAYFGPDSRVVGLDNDPGCKVHEGEGIEIFIGSQNDPTVLDAVLANYPTIDVVIDDGSHMMPHIATSFAHLYPRLGANGVYLVEDLHTAYWEEYGGGLHRPGSFMEIAKHLTDSLNAVHSRGSVPVSSFTTSTWSISFYDSIIAFEKRPQAVRQAQVTEGQEAGTAEFMPPAASLAR